MILAVIGFLFIMGALFIEGCRATIAILRWLWRSLRALWRAHQRGLDRLRADRLAGREPHRPGKAL